MKALLVVLMLFGVPYQHNYLSVPELRKLYLLAAIHGNDAVRFKTILSGVDNASLPVEVCYKGVSCMFEAKYTGNPFIKFKRFNTGKMLIENAIRRDRENVEIRLLRYAMQLNLPQFLGYHENMEEDRRYLICQLLQIKDVGLRDLVTQTLAAGK